MRFSLLMAVILLSVSVPVFAVAQDGSESSGYQARLELARRMNEAVPAREQVLAGVKQAAQALPEGKREIFTRQITDSFDFSELDAASVKAMAEIFSEAELTRMVDYYTSPEARSAEEKMPVYEEMIRPEVMRMLDRALMTLRTGEGTVSP